MQLNFCVDAADENMQTGAFLRKSGVSLALIKRVKFLADGILVNGTKQNTDFRLKKDDIITVNIDDTLENTAKSTVIANNVPINIVYEDKCCMVIDKPFDMPVHPSFNHLNDTLANGFVYYFAQKGVQKICRVINRLDRNTSGLVLVALDAHTAQRLKGKVDKTYTAIVKGGFEHTEGVIEAPIARSENSIITRCVSADGQWAKTQYCIKAQGDDMALVQIKLFSGRTHQIRVHFSYISHPLEGDELYGGRLENIARHALHCSQLTFITPDGEKPITITSALPRDMQRLCNNF